MTEDWMDRARGCVETQREWGTFEDGTRYGRVKESIKSSVLSAHLGKVLLIRPPCYGEPDTWVIAIPYGRDELLRRRAAGDGSLITSYCCMVGVPLDAIEDLGPA